MSSSQGSLPAPEAPERPERRPRLLGALKNLRRKPAAAGPSTPTSQAASQSAGPPLDLQHTPLTEEEKGAVLEGLPPDYYQEAYEPVGAELGGLSPRFDEAELEATYEERAGVLEVVSELLSKHVLENYDKFVAGISEVASVEADLQRAYGLVRAARESLRTALTNVRADRAIGQRQRQRQGLAAIGQLLLQLQEATQLRDDLRRAQDEGDFGGAFWLCAACARTLEPLGGLRVAGDLSAATNASYEDTLARLEGALQACCTDFNPHTYGKVLEGYVCLGNVATLGDEVMSAFSAVTTAVAAKVARSVVLARANSGLEERARTTQLLPELVKWIPPDQFRTCLARVLMVLFDVLASHWHMSQWHAARLEQHLKDVEALQELEKSLEERRASGAAAGTSQSSPLRTPGHSRTSSMSERLGGRSREGVGLSLAEGLSRRALHKSASHSGMAGLREGLRPQAEPPDDLQHSGTPRHGSPQRGHQSPRRGQLTPLGTPTGRRGFFEEDRAEEAAGGEEGQEAAALAERLRDERAWGEALLRVSEGLRGGRKWLWDEAARKVSALLASPAALQGEHFLKVLDWTQRMLGAGEAFSGSQSTVLRDALQRQSGRFFASYHATNLQALRAMLERESWARLPLGPGDLPSLAGALTGSRDQQEAFDTGNFGEWVARGNPWQAQLAGMNGMAMGSLAPSDAASGTPLGETSDDEPELYGEAIDEDSQQVIMRRPGSRGVELEDSGVVVTTASFRLATWLADYGALLRVLKAEAGAVWGGMAELFELYFLHAFHAFADVSLADIVASGQQRQGGADVIPVRLKSALARILLRSLPGYRKFYFQQPHAANGGPPGAAPEGPLPQRPPGGSEPTTLSNPGNMFGLLERKVAADSLLRLAELLTSALPLVGDALIGRPPPGDHHSLEAFGQTLKAATDLREAVLRAAARLNMPIRWLPERLAEQNFCLEEPPTRPSAWVQVLLGHLQNLRTRLQEMEGLNVADVEQVWQQAVAYAAEVVLDGIALAGAKGRCTPMGRSAMSLDLQALQRGLGAIAGGSTAAADALRVADTYIKAYYLPPGEELQRWAMGHPEYSRDQLMMLCACIAEAQGLKRKDKVGLLAALETALSEMRPGPR